VYYWPYNTTELSDGSIEFGNLGKVVSGVGPYDYYTFNDLEIRNFCRPTGAGIKRGAFYLDQVNSPSETYNARGFTFTRCNMHDMAWDYVWYGRWMDMIVDDCSFSNFGWETNGGAVLWLVDITPGEDDNPNNVVFKDSSVTGEFRGTPLHTQMCHDVEITGNTLTSDSGQHGNGGISIYVGSEDVLFANNYCAGSCNRVTTQALGNQDSGYVTGSGLGGVVVFYNNIIDNDRDNYTIPTSMWDNNGKGRETAKCYWINNMFIKSNNSVAAAWKNNSDEDLVCYAYNNIFHRIDVAGLGLPTTTFSHNIHLDTVSGVDSGDFGAGQTYEDDFLYDGQSGRTGHGDLLLDFLGHDYTDNDYAILNDVEINGAGIDISNIVPDDVFTTFDFTKDIAGNTRNLSAPSIGALEYDSPVPTPPSKATISAPTDSGTDIAITTDLSWSNGGGATSYNVYFGDANPPTFQVNQAGTTFDTGTMSNNTVYYWRIDAKNTEGITEGDLWSFTTVASAGGGSVDLSANCVLFLQLNDNEADSSTVTDSSGNSAHMTMRNSAGSPIFTSTQFNAMDGSPSPDNVGGYYDFASNAYASSIDAGELDVSTSDYSIAAWIRTSSKAAHEKIFSVDLNNNSDTWAMMYIKSSDGFARCSVHGGASVVDYYSPGGTPTDLSNGAWRHVVMAVNRSAETLKVYVDGSQDGTTTDISGVTGQSTYDYSSAFNYIAGGVADPPFTGDVAQLQVFDIEIDQDDVTHLYNSGEGTELLSNSGSVPSQATTPSPSNAATGVSLTAELSWADGGGAESYDVYFGIDATPDASEFIGNRLNATYSPSMDFGTTYYWRIDPVNTYGTTAGATWSFTTKSNTAPVITSNGGLASASTGVDEGAYTVSRVVATDADSDELTYSISGGSDSGSFEIDEFTGQLQFITAPNYDAPTDTDEDNQYVVAVQVSDGTDTDEQTITVTVLDIGLRASTTTQRMRARYGG
jgi:hypothetical protein